MEVPWERERSCRFRPKNPVLGCTGDPRPGRWVRVVCRPPERKDRRQRRYRQAKATKCGGKGGRKSQCPGSTEEAGEFGPAETRWREAGHQAMDPVGGNRARPLDRGPLSPQSHRLARQVARPLPRGTGCLSWARPDLREPGAGNRPRPPGHRSLWRLILSCYGEALYGAFTHTEISRLALTVIRSTGPDPSRNT